MTKNNCADFICVVMLMNRRRWCKYILYFFLFVIALIGNVSVSKSATKRNVIFVSTDGKENAPGDINHPKSSLQEALNLAHPGTTIYLRKGTYKGSYVFHHSGSRKRGYITVSAYKKEKVTISNQKNADGAAFNLNGCHYIRIQNLNIANLEAKNVYGVLLANSEHHITIKKCEFKKIVTTYPGTEYTPGGNSNAILLLGQKKKSIHHIYITGNKIHDNINGWSENISITGNCTRVFVRNNKVFNNTNIGIDFYGNAHYCSKPSLDQPRFCECTGNTVYNCKSPFAENAGIYIDGAKNILLKKNKVYNNFYGIEIGSEEWGKHHSPKNRVQNVVVTNNLLYKNIQCGLRLGGWTNDNRTGVVYNCKIIHNDFTKGNSKDGTEIILAKCDNILFKGNRFKNNANCKSVIYYDEKIDKSKITNIKFR